LSENFVPKLQNLELTSPPYWKGAFRGRWYSELPQQSTISEICSCTLEISKFLPAYFLTLDVADTCCTWPRRDGQAELVLHWVMNGLSFTQILKHINGCTKTEAGNGRR